MEKNSSLATVLALLNTMIGGAMLTYPILFRNAGLVTSAVVLLISGFISFKTCRIFVYHMGEKDKEVEDSIKRIAGLRWERFWRMLSGYYLLLLNEIYVDLIVDQAYSMLLYVMKATNHQQYIAQKSLPYLVFDKISIQYISLVMFFPLLCMVSIKKLDVLIKLAQFGVISVFIYSIFLLQQFISNFDSIKFTEAKLISWDLGNLAGTCALSFTIHTNSTTIIKQNRDQRNNVRDLRLSYILGTLFYLFIGFVGSSLIINKKCQVTIVNCYLDEWEVLFVQFSYLFGLTTVFPCFLSISRTRLLEYYYPDGFQTRVNRFNVAFMIVAITISFLSPYVPIDTVMNIVGSIVCYWFIYAIPTKVHFACLFGIKAKEQLSLLPEQSIKGEQSSDEDCNRRCPHPGSQMSASRKYGFYLFYLLVNGIGIAVGVYGLYTIFRGFF